MALSAVIYFIFWQSAVEDVGALGTTAAALGMSLGSASQLDGRLAFKDGLSIQLGDGTLSLEGVDRATKAYPTGREGD